MNTTHVRRVLGASGTTVITVDATGENTIVYSPGSNAQVTVDYVESVRDALTHSTVLGLCLESPIETVTAAARMCHEAGVKVLLNDSPFTPSLPAELIEASDILLVNEHEMAQLLGIDEPENDDWDSFDWWHALDELRGFGFEQAIVTLGGDGSVVLDGTADDPEHRVQRMCRPTRPLDMARRHPTAPRRRFVRPSPTPSRRNGEALPQRPRAVGTRIVILEFGLFSHIEQLGRQACRRFSKALRIRNWLW